MSKISPYNFIAFKKGLPTRRVLDQVFRKHHISVKITMEFDNIETIKRAVEIDAGISILPLATVAPETERGILKAIRIEGENLSRSLGILTLKKETGSIAVTKFIETLTT